MPAVGQDRSDIPLSRSILRRPVMPSDNRNSHSLSLGQEKPDSAAENPDRQSPTSRIKMSISVESVWDRRHAQARNWATNFAPLPGRGQ
jgi:hypothetical protein